MSANWLVRSAGDKEHDVRHRHATMDIKCTFIAIFVLVLINQQDVDTRLDRYAILLSENFDDINNVQLFEFVIRSPSMVNKVNE